MTSKADAQKIREAFAILTQGVEMTHYDIRGSKKAGIPSKKLKIVWMDSDILRFCVDDHRPTLIDRAKGKMPKGLYMRDIAEVRKGDETFDFRENIFRPANPNNCLSLIGTERTLSLELPGEMERDWFYDRLQLVAQDILTDGEKAEKLKWALKVNTPLSVEERNAAAHLKNVLLQGVQILHHHHNGRIVKAIISYDEAKKRLVLAPTEKTFLGFWTTDPYVIKVADIAEIRPGTHSIGFVRTNSTDKSRESMSIVGTECVMDLQLTNESARNIFAEKLRLFVRELQARETGDRGTGDVDRLQAQA